MRTEHRLRLLVAVLLIASGAFFAVASGVERSQHHEATTPAGESSGAQGSSTESGGESGGNSGHTETAPSATEASGGEDLFGVNPESTGLVVVAVLASLLLAVGVWFLGSRTAFVATLAFAIAFAALDMREVVHQIDASRTGLVVPAVALAALHLVLAAFATAGLRRRRPATATS